MSTTRSTTRAKVTQPAGTASKRGVAAVHLATGLSDSTNTVGTQVAKKSSLVRPSLVSNSAGGSVTPSVAGHGTTSRVPASVKQTDTTSKSTTTASKSSDSWVSLPTPVPISSSRSFSELIKSEDLLNSKVAQLHALLEKQQEEMSRKETKMRMMQAELEEAQELVTKTHQSWEAKCEALLAQQHEKYQDLNDRYLVVLTRARSCESKLEEMFIDPLTLQPFERRVAEQESAEVAVSQQRSLLALVEEQQSKENIDAIQSQKDLENFLRSAVAGLSSPETDVDSLIASARGQTFLHNENSLKQLELSIPNLLSEHNTETHTRDVDSSVSDLDWSVMTTDEPGSPAHGAESIEESSLFDNTQYSPPRASSTTASWQIDPEMSDDPDDAFFDQSIDESSCPPHMVP